MSDSEPGTRKIVPIACTLTATEAGDRLEEWEELRTHALGAAVATDRGARLRFPATSAMEEAVRVLVAAEQDCCAFFDFEITSDGDALVLDIGAPEDARPLVDLLAGTTTT